MEFQFGQVYIRIYSDLKEDLMSIKIIHPITSQKMMATNIIIQKYQGLWSTDVDQKTYVKGDKNAEESAFERRA